jgi:hypothetical protein
MGFRKGIPGREIEMAEWSDWAKFLDTHLDGMCEDARANGWEVIICYYSGLRVPVLNVLADGFGLVAGQELSNDQMAVIMIGMDSLHRRN